MFAAEPFRSHEEMLDAAERIWRGLDPADWIEAFHAHPRIGERAGDELSRREQSGVRGAFDGLREANRAYEERFGYIFIVCATGKSGEEILGILRGRMGNEPDMELRESAEQQLRITRLRLKNTL